MLTTKFLQSVLGDDGASVLIKTADRSPILTPVLIPRIVISWINTVSRCNYDGIVPGIDDSHFTIVKSENGLNGKLSFGDYYKCEFNNESVINVASVIGVALGIHDVRIDPFLDGIELTKLGKSLDLLVQQKTFGKLSKEELPGKAAQPGIPDKALQPAPQQKQQQIPKKAIFGKKEIKVSKEESQKPCSDCKCIQFKSKVGFVGCLCFKNLAKNIKSTWNDQGDYLIRFEGREWNDDTISALTSILKGNTNE